MDLDRTDIEIIRLLQKDVRLSNKQIAAAVGIAPSTCHERLKRLWSSGAIKGAHLDLDLKALGYSLAALFLIELAKHERETVDSLLESIGRLTEVRAAYLITGRYDLVVHVVARDMQHLKDQAFDNFTSHPAVTRIETSIVYDMQQNDNLLSSQDRQPVSD